MKVVYKAHYTDSADMVQNKEFTVNLDPYIIAGNMMRRARADGRPHLDFFQALMDCFPMECAYYISENVFDERLGTLTYDDSAEYEEKFLGITILNKAELSYDRQVRAILMKHCGMPDLPSF